MVGADTIPSPVCAQGTVISHPLKEPSPWLQITSFYIAFQYPAEHLRRSSARLQDSLSELLSPLQCSVIQLYLDCSLQSLSSFISSQGVWVLPPCATAWKLLKAIAGLHIGLILFVSQFGSHCPLLSDVQYLVIRCVIIMFIFFGCLKQESKAVFCYSILNINSINRSPIYQTSCFKFQSIYLII